MTYESRTKSIFVVVVKRHFLNGARGSNLNQGIWEKIGGIKVTRLN